MIVFFFFNDTATTEIYTLSLHDALPISWTPATSIPRSATASCRTPSPWCGPWDTDRKSTRLNSSHSQISYAVFCLKKKKKQLITNDSYSVAQASETLVLSMQDYTVSSYI